MIFSIFNIVFLVAFVLSAMVQYNDPDPLPWMAIYLSAGAMCLLVIRKQYLTWLPPMLLLVSFGWILVLLPSIVGQVSVAEILESISMKTREVEEAREVGGLLLVAIWASTVMIRRPRAF
jgi:hypothetical protein